ncbi:DMT family transporter [Prosthecomicrobium sp. N25]|uniref:DMT family transporter n=1 Tax=Prosthecomicrobium sp. N25 TaxID=3129254 RepID=UPI003077E6EE
MSERARSVSTAWSRRAWPQVEARTRGVRGRWDGIAPNVRGIIWILLSGVFFTVMSAVIKLLGTRIPVLEILFVRQLVLSVFVAPTVLRSPVAAFRTPYPGLHALRVTLSVVAMSAGFAAIVHMPLADAVAIGFSKSFFVTIFAILILGEIVSRQRWGATIAGFLGVIIMLQPSPEGLDRYALLSLVSAAAAGLIMVIIRRLAQKEKLVTVMAYQSIGVGLVFAGPALWSWVPPTPTEWLLLLSVGLLSGAGQSLNFAGFRVGEAAAVASADYLRLVYATLLGLWLFGEFPSLATLIGAAVIVATSVYSITYERSRGAREARLAAARPVEAPAE